MNTQIATSLLPNRDPSRVGDWIQTYSGGCFWPLDPMASEVRIEDIAHALSNLCRYAGHCSSFYSLAEHSVLVSHHVPREDALWGLLHDGAEAYSADIPRPLKRFLREWPAIESRIMDAICDRFGMAHHQPDSVTHADHAILSDERAALMAGGCRDWGRLPPCLGAEVVGMPPAQAKRAFLARYHELTR